MKERIREREGEKDTAKQTKEKENIQTKQHTHTKSNKNTCYYHKREDDPSPVTSVDYQKRLIWSKY